ncbi:DUF3347 domain-containing protein [Myroides guanonis]|uniref:DUF3347 domain-containing protein n=1 Tax=Myroides guanonis TaxID=1150112 RepID=A0A1I3UCR9_9FLAO|nr:DUF3347 domain-containing protein [Myroides guanonis]SFJ80523.1 Protein of unknown function [Myroides guanonis]
MKKVMIVAVIAAFGLVSCKDNNNKALEETPQVATEQVQKQAKETKHEIVSLVHSVASSGILDSYFDIKEALQEDDAIEAKKETVNLLRELDAFKSENAEASALVKEMKREAEGMLKEDLKEQRAHFEPLSHQVKQFINIVGSDRVVYEQYCPMYNENKGGMWLSDEEELLNPLFGNMMLRCGATKLEMQP